MTYDRDDLQALWEAYGQRLDASLRLNTVLLAEANLDKAKTALRPLLSTLGMEVGANVLALALLGWFAAGNIADARFAVPAIVLGLAAIAAVVLSVHQIVALRTIDFEAPVIAIRRALERLRLSRIRTTLRLLFVSPLLWVPLMIVGLRGVFGVDAYAFGSGFLLANLAFGAAVLAIGSFVARRVTTRRSRIADLLAGRSLSESLARIDTIERFAKE